MIDRLLEQAGLPPPGIPLAAERRSQKLEAVAEAARERPPPGAQWPPGGKRWSGYSGRSRKTTKSGGGRVRHQGIAKFRRSAAQRRASIPSTLGTVGRSCLRTAGLVLLLHFGVAAWT